MLRFGFLRYQHIPWPPEDFAAGGFQLQTCHRAGGPVDAHRVEACLDGLGKLSRLGGLRTFCSKSNTYDPQRRLTQASQSLTAQILTDASLQAPARWQIEHCWIIA